MDVQHSARRSTRGMAALAGTALVAAAAVGGYAGRYEIREKYYEHQLEGRGYNGAVMEKALMIAGGNPAEQQKESREASTIQAQFDEARTAPLGIVAPGAYAQAHTALTGLPTTGGAWKEVTRVPYNADDPRYRDWYSNSSGGYGHVTGRITGLAADSHGAVYAAGADGGVWRSTTGGGNWQPIADTLPTLSSGDLSLADDGSLWYSTGEANTGATTYVGTGVYRLPGPRQGHFNPGMRVGGRELQSTTIGHVRSGRQGTMFAATNRGIWYHDSRSNTGAWKFAFAPNMDWMPQIKDSAGNVLVPAGKYWTGNTSSGPTDAAYKNIVNDIAVDPRNPHHVIAAIGWRSGDTYNGFYETDDFRKGPSSWHRIRLGGQLNGTDIGYTTFAFSEGPGKGGNGHRLYALVQQPSRIAGGTNLLGVFESPNGQLAGPWTKIAGADKLRNSGSALSGSYDVGVQAWYNQFLKVDPTNADHVWVGLEEVFETKDQGTTWSAIAPYWNFAFRCWSLDDAKNTCPRNPHSDQHSVAVGGDKVFIGNDGGVYSRPVNGRQNPARHATDWTSLTTDGTMDALQYYSVAVGRDHRTGSGVIVSGGLQDNGVSNLFGVRPDGSNADPGTTGIFARFDTAKNHSEAGTMGSNFGGDGGDAAVDPRNGCNQLQEYTNLSVRVTNNCAINKGAWSEEEATSWDISPHDPGARFIAPFSLDSGNPDAAIFGGQYVWTNKPSQSIWQVRSGKALKQAFDLGAGHSATAVAMHDGVGYASWCGPCNNNGFARGLATNAGGSWKQLDVSALPNRFIQGIGIDPANSQHVFVAINGFSRRFTEGPGAGVGHVYETSDGGRTWQDISTNFPDIPASSVRLLKNGGLVVGTDLAVLYRAPGSTSWVRLGTSLPLTTVMKVESGPDGNLYAATHGRGIWSIPAPR